VDPPRDAAQFLVLLDEVDLVALVRYGQGGVHAGDAASDDERPLVDGQVELLEGLELAGPRHGHPDDVMGLVGGLFLLLLVDPGVVLPDVGHLVVVLVDPRLAQGVAEERLQCSRGAGGDDHAVQVLFLYLVRYLPRRVGGTGEELLLGVDDVGECLAVFHRAGDVDDPADVGAAVADEDAHPGLLLGYVPLFGVYPLPGEVAAAVVQHLADLGAGAGGAEDRLGDVDGALEGAGDKDPGAVRYHGVSGVEPAEVVLLELDAVLPGHIPDALRRVHADGEDDHVELLLDDTLLGGGVADGDVVRHRVFPDDRGVAPEEADAGEGLGPLVVALEVLAVGAHVVVEDRALRVGVVVLRQDDLLLGVGAADRGAVAVAALYHLAGADTLDPGDVVGVFQVGLAEYLAAVGAGGAQEPLVVHARDDVLELAVAVLLADLRIEGLEARGEDDGAHVDLFLSRLLVEIDGVVLTDRLADAAFLFFQVEAALVYVGDERDGLREVDVDRLVHRYVLVVLVRVLRRAVLHADGAARALVFLDIAGFPQECYVEVSRLALHTVNLGVGEHFDVGMPADLDQLGCENSHRAVVGREGLVELGHVAADRRGLLDEVHPEAGGREVQGRLDAAYAPADDHDVAEVALSAGLHQLLDIFVERYDVFHFLSPHRYFLVCYSITSAMISVMSLTSISSAWFMTSRESSRAVMQYGQAVAT